MSASEHTSQPPEARQNRTVLVADDDSIFRTVASGLITAWGYGCIAVADGQEALQRLQQPQPPTIALLDWQMPCLTGIEICRRLRSSNPRQYIYFILISARDGRKDSIEGLRSGADSYISKPLDAEELRAKLETATRILFMEESLRDLHAETELFINSVPSILIGTDTAGTITRWNHAAEHAFELDQEQVTGRTLDDCGIAWRGSVNLQAMLGNVLTTGSSSQADNILFDRDEEQRLLALSIHPLRSYMGAITGSIIIGADITEKRGLEDQLRQAQKLEAIGQLAAGIAHEINTPIQFTSDNVQFLKDSWTGLADFIAVTRELRSRMSSGAVDQETIAKFDRSLQGLDPDFTLQEVPCATAQALEGLQRVSKIVRAMKQFSHPGSEQKQLTDINAAIETTITVARNEWKYVAEVETRLDPQLPPVPCVPGLLNQVILNVIINAAHAIAEVVGDGAQSKGRIVIRTLRVGQSVEIAISDTGKGIPEKIRGRVFEPFFTTKEVGKGTGQGLALAHSIITKEHKGRIWFESKPGRGTEFFIHLPLQTGSGELPDELAVTD